MLTKQRNQGQYQGCFAESHWGGKRKSQQWDLFAKIAPKQAKICAELPNRIRKLVGVDTLKHANSKFKACESHSLPQALISAIESLLVDRIQLGEEVTHAFAQKLVQSVVAVWNDKVQELHQTCKQSLGTRLLADCESLVQADMTEDEAQELQDMAVNELEVVLASIKPVCIPQRQNGLVNLDCKMAKITVQYILLYCTVQ